MKTTSKAPRQSVRNKFTAMRKDMTDALIERDEEVDVVLTALIAQEHPLLVGAPGTAKSMLLDMLMEWLGPSGNRFSVLFNKFTTPEEVFGPISVRGLKDDSYRRIPDGMFQQCHFGLGDEIFKASSAILNTLLRGLNERVYAESGTFQDIPLLMFVAASNEWPNDQDGGRELGALFDRFLFRKTVRCVSKASRDRLLFGNVGKALSTSITPSEIQEATSAAYLMEWDQEAKEALHEILNQLNTEGIFPGDRRMRKAVKAAQSYAYLNDAEFVETIHLEILAHVLWDDPTEQPAKCQRIVSKIANPTGWIITDKLMLAESILASKVSATEMVPKLKDVQRELKELPDGAKRNTAINYIAAEIKRLYSSIVGEV